MSYILVYAVPPSIRRVIKKNKNNFYMQENNITE